MYWLVAGRFAATQTKDVSCIFLRVSVVVAGGLLCV